MVAWSIPTREVCTWVEYSSAAFMSLILKVHTCETPGWVVDGLTAAVPVEVKGMWMRSVSGMASRLAPLSQESSVSQVQSSSPWPWVTGV